MNLNEPLRAANTPRDHWALLQGLIDRPRDVAYVVPSSRFLVASVVRRAAVARARLVVELGPGTGGTTRRLLQAMPPDARLLAIELHPRFVRHLERAIRDPRLLVHRGDAAELGEVLHAHGLSAADAVVSGIPFSHLTRREGRRILRAVRDNLMPGGRFVAYQLRRRVEQLADEVFGPGRVTTELRNLPPMRVSHWVLGASPTPATLPRVSPRSEITAPARP